MGDASSVKMSISKEASWGTVVAAGGQYQRITSVSPKLRANVVQSAEIDPARQPVGSVRTSKSAELSFGYELSLVAPIATPGTGPDLLVEGTMMSAWSTIIALASQSIAIGTPAGDSFVLTGSGTSSTVFTGMPVGQILKLGGYATNGTVYARIKVAGTSTCLAEGMRSTGAVVTNESASGIVSVAGSYIRCGAIKQSYSAEVVYSDLSVPEYSLLTGLRVGTWEERFTPEGIVAGTYTFMGKLQATLTTSSITTVAAKWSTPRINTTDNNFKLKMEGSFGVASTIRIAEINFRCDNKLRTDLELGASGPADIGISTPTVEGTMVAYMSTADMLRKYEADTLSKLSWMLDDGTRQRIYTFNAIRFRDGMAEATGNDQTVRVTMPFSVEPDANGISWQIDRY